MAIKKKVNGTWQPITPKQLKGMPYTGTLPAVITGTKAGHLHRYKVYGNLEQTGTPTPENPIVPQECGEKTENLFDKDSAIPNKQYDRNGNLIDPTEAGAWYASGLIEVEPNETYVRCKAGEIVGNVVNFYAGDNTFQGRNTPGAGVPFSIPSTAKYISFAINANTNPIEDFMLVEGSTAPTQYIPYGYKLPLTSAGQNVDIYLAESQTTRRIKKLVLDGTENWIKSTKYIGSCYAYLFDVAPGAMTFSPIVCTHTGDTSGAYQYGNGRIDRNSLSLWLFDSKVTTADFKAYLAQQYANGTPVTVWYVLATEETGTLNEPLRKIGDYADTIDSTQTATQIPTTANSTTISWAGEGLAPSQFDSIQEWVDAQTYTRVNGAWVVDN